MNLSFALLSKFKRCFYEMSKELFDEKTKSNRFRNRQLFNICFFYATFRIYFIVYVMYNDFKGPVWYDFRRYDVMTNFLHTFSDTFDYTIVLMINFFNLIFFLFEWWSFHLDARRRSWRFWYQLTVATLDDYHRCQFTGSKLRAIQALKMAKYENKLSLYPFIPVSLAKRISSTLALIEIFLKMEHVNVVEMQRRPIPLMPLLSWKNRSMALKIMLLTEYCAFFLQIIIGN